MPSIKITIGPYIWYWHVIRKQPEPAEPEEDYDSYSVSAHLDRRPSYDHSDFGFCRND